MTKVMKACGADLSPENMMKQATSLKAVKLPGLIPGIAVNTSPDDYGLIKSLRPQRFDGTTWVPISEAISVNEYGAAAIDICN